MKANEPGRRARPTVEEHIATGNQWYVGRQFTWADKPSIRRIYARRSEYFVACLERARARLGPPLRVLDIGCGDGYWLHRLRDLPGVELAGVDYNPLRVERARQAAPHAKIHCADFMAFRPDQAFDVVLLNQVIEHIDDDVGVLRRVRELLRPAGVLIVGTPNEGSRLQRWRIRPEATDHVHFYTEDEVRQKLEQAGFAIESVMREVFYVGFDAPYYRLTRWGWGFRLLELLTRWWPSQCSDYYFECRVREVPRGAAAP